MLKACVLSNCTLTRADTHHVDATSKSPTQPYTKLATASQDIQAAIDAAEDGDTVRVAAGTYKITTTLVVKKSITIQGAGAESTVIDAQGKCQCIKLGKASTLRGFTITGGKAREGAGVACGGGSVVTACTIIGNTAERYGGGISVRAGGRKPVTATVSNCKIVQNRVIDYMHTDTPWGGGGIYADGSVVVTNCVIQANEAAQRAGGIWCHGGATLAENCTITNNRAYGKRKRNPNGHGSMEEGGGGAYCDFGGQLRGCVIYENHADRIGGGAVLSTNGRAKNCTITKNTSGLSGAGVQTLGPGHVVNSIVIQNSSGENGDVNDDVYVSHYYHVDVHQLMLGKAYLRHSCIGTTKLHYTRYRFYLGRTAGYDPNNYKNQSNEVKLAEPNPRFVDAGKGNFRITAGSACIDAGLNEKWMDDNAKDIDGHSRVFNETVDIGAFEIQ
jgi:hypothetical protein